MMMIRKINVSKQFFIIPKKDGTLEDAIEDTRAVNKELRFEDIQLWIYQLLKGIDFLHSNNLIHRDLKPS